MRLCHSDDPEHKSYKCRKPCQRRCTTFSGYEAVPQMSERSLVSSPSGSKKHSGDADALFVATSDSPLNTAALNLEEMIVLSEYKEEGMESLSSVSNDFDPGEEKPELVHITGDLCTDFGEPDGSEEIPAKCLRLMVDSSDSGNFGNDSKSVTLDHSSPYSTLDNFNAPCSSTAVDRMINTTNGDFKHNNQKSTHSKNHDQNVKEMSSDLIGLLSVSETNSDLTEDTTMDTEVTYDRQEHGVTFERCQPTDTDSKSAKQSPKTFFQSRTESEESYLSRDRATQNDLQRYQEKSDAADNYRCQTVTNSLEKVKAVKPGHACKKLCYENCSKCKVKVDKVST